MRVSYLSNFLRSLGCSLRAVSGTAASRRRISSLLGSLADLSAAMEFGRCSRSGPALSWTGSRCSNWCRRPRSPIRRSASRQGKKSPSNKWYKREHPRSPNFCSRMSHAFIKYICAHIKALADNHVCILKSAPRSLLSRERTREQKYCCFLFV
jgi:hypothetical protein